MEGKLPDAVDAPTAWVMRKTMFAALMNRRADAVTRGRRQGAVPVPPDRAVRADAPPAELYGTKVVRSSQVSDTRVEGSGDEPDVHPARLLPGLDRRAAGRDGVPASGLGDTALQNDQTYLRGIQHIDAGPRHAASFVLCDQLRRWLTSGFACRPQAAPDASAWAASPNHLTSSNSTHPGDPMSTKLHDLPTTRPSSGPACTRPASNDTDQRHRPST